MPFPAAQSPARSKLDCLVGLWVGEEQVAASAWTAAGSASSDAETGLILDGLFVEQRYRQFRDGAVSFESRNIIGIDPGDGSYKLYQFDSTGFPPPSPATGRWEEDRFVFERVSSRGEQRTEFRFESDDAYVLEIRFRPPAADAWQLVMRGTFRRAQALPKREVA